MQHSNNNIFSLNLRTILAIIAVFFIVFFVLLTDKFLHISISSIIELTDHTADKKHFIVLAILPIYIAVMIFGAASAGIYLGSWIESLLARKRQKFTTLSTKKST